MKKFKSNGETQQALMELIINEIRENREAISDVNNILRVSTGQIAANKSAITNLKWAFVTGITIIIAFLGWTAFGG
ncbi:MAG: hypothetical protein Unbinned1693contig1002_53 [Prokaryotic dsDNA virus sp.]|jgi:hypothetical protein|nr:MAG: hypothetical protein Unbinned1693contig1002_53 [Prokaryotic dsDNA virus sp.]|tara:strand:+ start:24665 stop:24892 length:228 start_codon:yes stop_codon:yes gene_type:complete